MKFSISANTMKVGIELQSPKDVVVKHQSLAYDAIRRKRTNKKVGELQEAGSGVN